MKLFAQDKWLEGIQGPVLPTLANSELIAFIQIQFLVVAGRLQNNSHLQNKVKLTSPLPVFPTQQQFMDCDYS